MHMVCATYSLVMRPNALDCTVGAKVRGVGARVGLAVGSAVGS